MKETEPHKRQSIRLKDYDYSQAGVYFLTICVKDKQCFFGEIINDEMVFNDIGKIAEKFWRDIPVHYPNIELDEFIIMPNHIHGILVIVGIQHVEPLPRRHEYQKTIPKSIGSIIRIYKASVTNWCRNNGFEFFQWQRNYYEHIIRSEKQLKAIREYIRNNPYNWPKDSEYPNN